MVEQSPIFSKSFTGFMLYDPATKTTLYQKDADKYYTPASNTKIFTFYTALKILGDSLPLLHYVERGDSLFFWGTGNPAFFNHDLPQDGLVYDFLKNHHGPLFFLDGNFKESRFGPGWAWDDYQDYYQPEKSSFPIYGNVVRFERKAGPSGFSVTPNYFRGMTQLNTSLPAERPYFSRAETKNRFEYNKSASTAGVYSIDKPFETETSVLIDLLQDTLGRPVQYYPDTSLFSSPYQILSSPMPDTLYQRLMKDSDNFIAEQLILLCADKQFGVLQSSKMLAYAKQTLYKDAPDELLWHDGSGLTRYNMFTPRTVVYVLEKLWQEKPKKWLFKIFPGGGQAGTVSQWYGGDATPYVFAKTGTLRNKHCLSGYLITQSGRVLIFSFMHNNFPTGSAPLKQEMAKVLQWLRAEM